MQIAPSMTAFLVTEHCCITDDIDIITVASDNKVFSVVYRPHIVPVSQNLLAILKLFLTLFPQIIIAYIWAVT